MNAIVHHGITIVTLAIGANIAACCRPGQTAICERPDGWWLYFVDSDGSIEGYDTPYPSHAEALWAARAAAEFSAE